MARIETQVRWSQTAAVTQELRVFAFARNGNGATWFPAVVGNPEFMPSDELPGEKPGIQSASMPYLLYAAGVPETVGSATASDRTLWHVKQYVFRAGRSEWNS